MGTLMLHAIIFLLSTLILVIGLLNLRVAHYRATIISIFAIAIVMNGFDVIVPGDQTLYRQFAYLSQSFILAAYSIRKIKGA